MKKQLILIMALSVSTLIYAQHGKRHGDISEKMKSELSLNDTQYQSIKAIESKYHDKQVALRSDSAKGKEQKLESMKALRTEQSKEVNAVLTAEQKTKWEAYRKTQSEKGKARMEASGQRLEQRIKTDLALSDDQFAKFQSENKLFRGKMADLHKTDKSDANKVAFEKLKTEHESKIKSILSADQYQKWTKMKEEMKKKSHDHKRRG